MFVGGTSSTKIIQTYIYIYNYILKSIFHINVSNDQRLEYFSTMVNRSYQPFFLGSYIFWGPSMGMRVESENIIQDLGVPSFRDTSISSFWGVVQNREVQNRESPRWKIPKIVRSSVTWMTWGQPYFQESSICGCVSPQTCWTSETTIQNLDGRIDKSVLKATSLFGYVTIFAGWWFEHL